MGLIASGTASANVEYIAVHDEGEAGIKNGLIGLGNRNKEPLRRSYWIVVTRVHPTNVALLYGDDNG